MRKRFSGAAAAVLTAVILTGFAQQQSRPAETDSADTQKAAQSALFSDSRAAVPPPQWVTALDAAKDAEQLIVVAGYDTNTAYISMHEKQDGKWMKLLSTPGFV